MAETILKGSALIMLEASTITRVLVSTTFLGFHHQNLLSLCTIKIIIFVAIRDLQDRDWRHVYEVSRGIVTDKYVNYYSLCRHAKNVSNTQFFAFNKPRQLLIKV